MPQISPLLKCTAWLVCFLAQQAIAQNFIGVDPQSASATESHIHPLDDLSKEEIEKVAKIIRASNLYPRSIRFVFIKTKEPKKEIILAYEEGKATIPREAQALLYDRTSNQTWDLIIDIINNKIISSTKLNDTQPLILTEEYELATHIVTQDDQWKAALKKHGFENPQDIYIDVWAPGLLSEEEIKLGHRLVRALAFYKGSNKNVYARPIEGLIATVDLNTQKVINIWNEDNIPIPAGSRDLDESSNLPLRTDIKPLIISQPDGPSFKINGRKVEWQKWAFRLSLDPVKGLTLYRLTYNDGEPRSILYKGNLSEMVVPYGQTKRTWTFRSAFDAGEYGAGLTAHSFKPIIDLPENAFYIDSIISNNDGFPLIIPNSIAIYERDGGRLWKHYDTTTLISECRRARELVVTYMMTIGNYDYAFNWIFHQDGAFEIQVELTGIVLSQGTTQKTNPCQKDCFYLLEPLIAGPVHQHFFNFRLDLDIDGNTSNMPIETNMWTMPISENNPEGNGFQVERTFLKNETARDLNLSSARMWKMISTKSKNKMGHPTGYGLMPGENSVFFVDKTSSVSQRAGFIHHPIWFTRYHDDEQSAAGNFPNQNELRLQENIVEGLPHFIANNESIEGEDVVVWYTMGITHITRPEDWPVMPVHRAGIKLMPINFFDQNPAMDVSNAK